MKPENVLQPAGASSGQQTPRLGDEGFGLSAPAKLVFAAIATPKSTKRNIAIGNMPSMAMYSISIGVLVMDCDFGHICKQQRGRHGSAGEVDQLPSISSATTLGCDL
jgi:hypothetical protein